MENISLLTEKPLLLKNDILAFILIYGVMAPILLQLDLVEFIYLKFFLVLLFFFNCLFFLLCESSDYLKAHNRFNKTTDIKNATHVYYVKKNKHSKMEYSVIKIEEDKIKLENGLKTHVRFFFRQKLKYYWQKENKKFVKIQPFLQQTVKTLIQNPNSIWMDSVEKAMMEQNNLVFPLPSFKQIFKEQIMDPLSFFQLFSSALWFFDDNFFYPLMTICLLVVTNVMLCTQRISTILNLRSLQTKPYFVYVLQDDGTFKKKSSEELISGDVIQIQNSKALKIAETKAKGYQNLMDELRKIIPLGDKLPPQVLLKFLPKENEQTEIVNTSDLLVLRGTIAVDESILTGENLPQIKTHIEQKFMNETFHKSQFKNSIVYAGTDIVSVNTNDSEPALGMVLNTGFYTTKGKLARTVLFNEENNQTTQKEAYLLLFILLIVSIVSSVYVLIVGLEDEERDKNKLFLRCIGIVTSVVPPELPMIMSMAINHSLQYLRKKRLFCTEPHRINLAGKIQTCVFDKTGTLTKESLIFREIAVYDEANNNLTSQKNLKENYQHSDLISLILAGCQSLVEINGQITGDPIEMLFFDNSDWTFSYSGKQSFYKKDINKFLRIKNTFLFNSELKRMSSIVFANKFSLKSNNLLVTKGAPEVLGQLMESKPPQYEEWYRQLALKGYRILALAYKELTPQEVQLDDRFELEKNLKFAGFLILENNLKKDTKQYIKHLVEADKKIVILTGDHLLTSIATFQSLKINSKKTLIVKCINEEIKFFDQNDNEVKTPKLDQFNLTTIGTDLDQLIKKDENLVHQLSVVARVDPKQKEVFIGIIQKREHVLMCGDGTNDVGALKRADVGIALVGKKEEPSKELKEERKKKKQDAIKQAFKERKRFNPADFNFDMEDMDFKLGDASIAAPFTNKHSNSLKCVVTILRQGLATLTSGYQSYKIVTLTSLMSAYAMSFLHLENLKFSDYQNTLLGIYGSYLYFLLSSGTPVKKLPKDKPQQNIFNKYFWMSLLGQVVIFLGATYLIMDFSKKYAPDEQKDIDNEEEFIPTFINSCMFLNDLTFMLCTYIFNFEGRPFMQSLSEYKKHFKFIMLPIGLIFILIFNISDDITGLFQTTFTSKHPNSEFYLFVLIFGQIFLVFAWTTLIKYLNLKRIDKWIQLIQFDLIFKLQKSLKNFYLKTFFSLFSKTIYNQCSSTSINLFPFSNSLNSYAPYFSFGSLFLLN